MTKKDKEIIGFISVVILALLHTVGFDLLKGTALKGVIMVVLGLIAMSFFTTVSVRSLVQKEWSGALVCAALAGIVACLVWTDWSSCPWDQLPEEIDMVVNFYKTLWMGFDSAGCAALFCSEWVREKDCNPGPLYA